MMRYFEIETAAIFDVTGQDSQRYLNARLTQNIKSLPVGDPCLGAALTPQGRTQGLFLIGRLHDQHFLLVSDAGNRDELYTAVRRYIVADRVTITDATDSFSLLHVAPGSKAQALSGKLGVDLSQHRVAPWTNGFVIAHERGFGEGFDIIINKQSREEFVSWLQSQDAHQPTKSDVTAARILARIPSFPEEINESTLFSEARFIQAIAINKGCYVGQEVVEKVEAVGKTARILQVVECEGCVPLSPHDPVMTADGAQIGKVLSCAWSPQLNRTVAFVQIKNDPHLNDQQVQISGMEGTVRWAQ